MRAVKSEESSGFDLRGSHGKNTGAVCHFLLIGKDPDAGKD